MSRMNKIKIIFPWVHVRLILFHLLQIFHCLTSPDRKSFLLDSEYSFSELGVIVIKIFCTISGEYFLLFMIILYESNTLCSYILLDIKYPVPFRTKMKIFYLSTSTSMLLMFNFMYLNDFVIIFSNGNWEVEKCLNHHCIGFNLQRFVECLVWEV